MTLATVILLGLVIGSVLGGMGGGGAVLTVPALVYLIGQSAQNATTSSLVIVGATAIVGSVPYLRSGRLRWKLGLILGAVGVPAAWLGSILNNSIDANLLLLAFAGIMIVAALAMTGIGQPRGKNDDDGASGPGTREDGRPALVAVVATALGIGLLTGFFGVGGGFVVIPALVVLLGIPMRHAVGTSLMVVALNSVSSLIARVGTAEFEWKVIVPFTVTAMIASLIGKRVADRLPAAQIKKAFAVLLVLVAGYTAFQSGSALI